MFTAEQIKQLEAPLERRFVKPPPKGRFGDYVEGWHCIAEANRIFGFDGWTRETTIVKLGEPIQSGDRWIVNYSGKVKITVGPIIREGCGFGQGIDRDLGRAHESALKEAETDAMKRALMTFGNPFGLALYDKTQENVSDAPPRPQEAPTQANGVKRLTSARAKEIGLDVKLKGLVEGCESILALNALERNFDKLTEEAPLSWLDSINNMILLKRDELIAAEKHHEMDAEYRAVVA